MHRNTLARIAQEVWGYGWRQELARVTGRHPVTVRRWAAGLTLMSEQDHYDVARALLTYSKHRYKSVRQMVARLEAYHKAAKTQANSKTNRSFQTKRYMPPKNPIPPWKILAQGLENLPDF